MTYSINIVLDVKLAPHCEALQRDRKLSGLINILLTNYFLSQENSPNIIKIQSENDIDEYVEMIRDKVPDADEEALSKLKESMILDLKGGEYIINKETGDRQKMIKYEQSESNNKSK